MCFTGRRSRCLLHSMQEWPLQQANTWHATRRSAQWRIFHPAAAVCSSRYVSPDGRVLHLVLMDALAHAEHSPACNLSQALLKGPQGLGPISQLLRTAVENDSCAAARAATGGWHVCRMQDAHTGKPLCSSLFHCLRPLCQPTPSSTWSWQFAHCQVGCNSSSSAHVCYLCMYLLPVRQSACRQWQSLGGTKLVQPCP
jgi:hypothetical protein